MAEIAQGARSQVRVVKVDGITCVEKRYNERKDPPHVKLSREVAFYEAYPDVDIIPRLVSFRDPDLIVTTYVPGDRLIDLLNAHPGRVDISAVSRSYGTGVVEFLNHKAVKADVSDVFRSLGELVDLISNAVSQDPRYQLQEIVASLDQLPAILEAGRIWSQPMMCKYDWSASNMLIQSNSVTCIFDFDTSYIGTRLSFIGDILRSTMLHLDWIATRDAIALAGVDLPTGDSLVAASHLSRWQVALSSFVDGRFTWPEPDEMCATLTRLSSNALS